jgi:hypothetical protein
MEAMKSCNICQQPAAPVFTATLLQKHRVQFLDCPHCGLLQTEKAHWLDEAYSTAITRQDTGLVWRNILCAERLEPFLHFLYPRDAKFVDVGGGYGMLTRLLRDRGFDAYTTDPFCEPILARGFEPPAGTKAAALFAFEVLEHTPDGLSLLKEAFNRFNCRTIYFSTTTFSGPPPAADWEYYGFTHGQHISIYRETTLDYIAAQLGCVHFRFRDGLHLITAKKLPARFQWSIQNRTLAKWLAYCARKARKQMSLTLADSRRFAERT